MRMAHYEPGEMIIKKREIGRELYVIQSGDVEVIADGTLVATLHKGEVFGEKALLTDAPRTANVRAKTAVDVLVLTRAGFSALVSQFQPMETFFGELMHQRYPELVPQQDALRTLIAAASAEAHAVRAANLPASSSSTLPS
jgi:voltage-gated potassium channel